MIDDLMRNKGNTDRDGNRSNPYHLNPAKACEACCFGRGEHAPWCLMFESPVFQRLSSYRQSKEAPANDEEYANIRKILGEIIGARVVDVTQHDEDEWEGERSSYVMLMFDNGCFVKFPVGDDGFDHNCTEEE